MHYQHRHIQLQPANSVMHSQYLKGRLDSFVELELSIMGLGAFWNQSSKTFSKAQAGRCYRESGSRSAMNGTLPGVFVQFFNAIELE